MLKPIQEKPMPLAMDNTSKDTLVGNASTTCLQNTRRKKPINRPSKNDLSENIKNHQLDSISDDELPDDLIMYDIPSIESLQNLETRRKSPINRKHSMRKFKSSNFRYLPPTSSSSASSSMSSPATRASSIFSHSSNFSDVDPLDNDDYHNQLSREARLLFSNKNYKLEESLQRISLLKSISRQSLDSVSSFASDNSTTILLKSKTKSFISSTRQPNLPPKDTFDLKTHENQYQLILNAQIQIEHQKMEQYKKLAEKKNTQLNHDIGLWTKVVNNYSILIKLPQTRELWWRSMPDDIRPIIWQRQLIKREKLMSDEDLNDLLKKMDKQIDLACNYKMCENDELIKIKFQKENPSINELIESVEKFSSLIQISFPDVGNFQYGETFDSILKICLAFNNLKYQFDSLKSISTDKLVNIICVLFYVFKSELLTLESLLTLVQKKLINSLLTADDIVDSLTEQLKLKSSNEYLLDIQHQVDKFLLNMTPRLYNHFIQHDINTLKIIQSLISTLFTKQLNLDVILRIFDIYLFEGDSFLLRCILALIKKLNWKLFGSRDDIYQLLGDDCLFKLNELELTETESINSQSTLSTKRTLHSTTSRVNITYSNSNNSNNTINNPNDGRNHFIYLDVGESDDFISDIRSVLKKKN